MAFVDISCREPSAYYMEEMNKLIPEDLLYLFPEFVINNLYNLYNPCSPRVMINVHPRPIPFPDLGQHGSICLR